MGRWWLVVKDGPRTNPRQTSRTFSRGWCLNAVASRRRWSRIRSCRRKNAKTLSRISALSRVWTALLFIGLGKSQRRIFALWRAAVSRCTGISLSDRATVRGLTMAAYPKFNEARTFTTVDRQSSRRRWSECRLNYNIASLVSIGTSKRNGINIVKYILSRSPLNSAHLSPTITPLSILLSAPSILVVSSSQP